MRQWPSPKSIFMYGSLFAIVGIIFIRFIYDQKENNYYANKVLYKKVPIEKKIILPIIDKKTNITKKKQIITKKAIVHNKMKINVKPEATAISCQNKYHLNHNHCDKSINQDVGKFALPSFMHYIMLVPPPRVLVVSSDCKVGIALDACDCEHDRYREPNKLDSAYAHSEKRCKCNFEKSIDEIEQEAVEQCENKWKKRHGINKWQNEQLPADICCFLALKDHTFQHPKERPPRILIPGLRSIDWWSDSSADLAKGHLKNMIDILESNWKDIRDEVKAVADAGKIGWTRTKLAEWATKELEVQHTKKFPRSKVDTSEFNSWHVMYLISQGHMFNNRKNDLPKTMRILEKLKPDILMPMGDVYISMLVPGVHVIEHCGPTNHRVRMHLGLDLPPGATFRVGNISRSSPGTKKASAAKQITPRGFHHSEYGDGKAAWQHGKISAFGDGFEHEVYFDERLANNVPRIVLLVDTWHPDLTLKQREILTKAFGERSHHSEAQVQNKVRKRKHCEWKRFEKI